ncbi:MAG: hypothetical protein J5819_06605, partial [Eubacterium sp.]|nr:hypothetical protein [Eubacterium sp.]
KKFNKYVKSYKKLKKTSFNKTEGLSTDLYEEANVDFYSKDLYWKKLGPAEQLDTMVMRHDKTSATDPYRYYSQAGEYATRFILAPNVASGTSANYQETQWKQIVNYQMDFSSEFPMYDVLEKGSSFGVSAQLESITYNMEIDTPDGKKTKVTQYEFSSMDTLVDVNVFQEGVLKGKIERVLIGEIGITANMWLFTYDQYAEYDGQWMDPATESRCYADETFLKQTGAKARSLTINYGGTNPAIKSWTVSAADSVILDFPFVSSDDVQKTGFEWRDGTTVKPLPLSMSDADAFAGKLNFESPDGVYSTDASIANSIYWKEF